MKYVLFLLVLLSSPAWAQADKVDKQDLAYRLVGYLSFVESSCSGMSVDYDLVRLAVDGLGLDIEKAKARALTKKGKAELGMMMFEFRSNIKSNCKLMVKWFGPDGETMPGLIDLN